MKKTYIIPQINIHHLASSRIVCVSGPGAGDQENPSGPSGARLFQSDWEDDDTDDEDM